jgi:hypothetical protein
MNQALDDEVNAIRMRARKREVTLLIIAGLGIIAMFGIIAVFVLYTLRTQGSE